MLGLLSGNRQYPQIRAQRQPSRERLAPRYLWHGDDPGRRVTRPDPYQRPDQDGHFARQQFCRLAIRA
jgi:hypothetical protein